MLALAPLAARRRHENHLNLAGHRKKTGVETDLDLRGSEIPAKEPKRVLPETSPTA
jgi:hypothetical protein